MGQAQINVRTRACSRTSIARTKQAALTHSVRGKMLIGCIDKVYVDTSIMGAGEYDNHIFSICHK